MQNKDDFILELTIKFPEVIDRLKEENEYWFPDTPPLIVLLSDLAREIAEIDLTNNRKKVLFDLLEYNLEYGDEELSTAVATGFLEIYYYHLKEHNLFYDDFFSYLGKQSESHIKGVIEFFGY